MNIEKLKKTLLRLKDRYFRPVIAYPDGYLTHHGDCDIHRSLMIYGTAPCTCGFLHDLQALPGSIADKLYPERWHDLGKQEGREEDAEGEEVRKILVENLFGKVVSMPEELSEEEENAIIEEIFGKN